MKTKANVNVRCPRCGETYPLAAVLDHDIPALEIVEDQEFESSGSVSKRNGNADGKYHPVTEKENGRFVVPNYVTKAAVKPNRRRRRGADASRLNQSEDRETTSESRRSRDNAARSTRSRATKKRHPAVELMMVILGGCMSIPVAQLMVWWILGLDPLGVAADVARVIPIVVPSDLRESEPITKDPLSQPVLDKDT